MEAGKKKHLTVSCKYFSGSIPKMLRERKKNGELNGNIQPSQQVLLCVINIVFSYAR